MQTRDALDRAIAEDLEATRLRGSMTALREEGSVAREQLEAHRRAHSVEEADVRALEGLGLTRVLSAVRGTRTGELERERAEEVAARYAMQAAVTALQHLEGRAEQVEQALARLGDTAARRSGALDAHADAMRSSDGAGVGELDAICDELAGVRAEAREVAQARGAGARAAASLDTAMRELGSADGWSAYDTWFGGGLISSSLKHGRIDEAGRRIEQAQAALADFAREIADVQQVSALRADLGITPMARTFDVWFDNIFSDLSVRRSIKESIVQVDRVSVSVRTASEVTAVRAAELSRREADLLARRDEELSRRG
ncbi:MAG: hypothetical protein ABIU87_11645 [Ornithinibacter sp.]